MDVLKVIEELVGKEAKVTKTDFEGPEIGVYTANPLYFLEHEDAVRKIATTLKKRVNIRSDARILLPPEKARDIILEVVPVDAGITNMWFLDSLGTVRIEARKPGLVIGKDGETLKEIVKRTGWMVKVLRAPSSESSVLKGIRGLEVRHLKERIEFLRRTSGRIFRGIRFPNTWVRLHALGGFMEVGRSMLMLETK
ncbi:MAG: beta-CASP ribonuclease aCPSF1, partial [Candidatus Diapherotrites archaeon]|nr:beta-CASP ribonuclease aCPSF1 [Candidatus Diapherotrites archaeon]